MLPQVNNNNELPDSKGFVFPERVSNAIIAIGGELKALSGSLLDNMAEDSEGIDIALKLAKLGTPAAKKTYEGIKSMTSVLGESAKLQTKTTKEYSKLTEKSNEDNSQNFDDTKTLLQTLQEKVQQVETAIYEVSDRDLKERKKDRALNQRDKLKPPSGRGGKLLPFKTGKSPKTHEKGGVKNLLSKKLMGGMMKGVALMMTALTLLPSLGKTFLGTLGSIGKLLMSTGAVVGRLLLTLAPIAGWIAAIAAVGYGIFKLGSRLKDDLANANTLLNKEKLTLTDYIAVVQGSLAGSVGAFADMVAGWFGFSTNYEDMLRDTVTKGMANIFDRVKDTFHALGDFIDDMSIVKWGREFVDIMSSFREAIFSKITDWIEGAWDKLAPEWMKTSASKISDGYGNMKNKLEKVGDTFSSLFDTMKEKVEGAINPRSTIGGIGESSSAGGGGSSGDSSDYIPTTGKGAPKVGSKTRKVLNTSDRLLNGIASREGFSAKPYWDYKQWTNGYGTKAKYKGERISKKVAEQRLAKRVGRDKRKVLRFVPKGTPRAIVDALTSLSYNAGYKWMKSGLGKQIKAKQWGKARKTFLSYNRAGGKVNRGLVKRRKIEAGWGWDSRGQSRPALARRTRGRNKRKIAPALSSKAQKQIEREIQQQKKAITPYTPPKQRNPLKPPTKRVGHNADKLSLPNEDATAALFKPANNDLNTRDSTGLGRVAKFAPNDRIFGQGGLAA